MAARVSLDQVRSEEDTALYPSEALDGLSSAFMGFCAAFLGRQDCVVVADAGLTATCVDIDEPRLEEMRPLYPIGWRFVHADVFNYAALRYAQGARFDVVSLDPPTNLFQQVADNADLWCGLARRVVILGTGHHTLLEEPYGWTVTEAVRRSHFRGGTYWTTLRPV
jgi:hypothetical protein